MSERWWRAYDGALHDPKLLTLSDRLHRAWFNLLCVASKNDGILPTMAIVAIELRVTLHKAAEYVTALVTAGLIDEIETGKFAPHNWGGRQFQSDVSTGRVKRFRKRQGNVSSAVFETPPYTETEAETEAEKKETRAKGALAPGWPEDFREQFWEAYPNKVGKPDALKKLERVAKSGKVEFTILMAGLHRYATKADDRPFCNPATWINQERWNDQPANVNGQGNRNSRRTDDGAVRAGFSRAFGVGDGGVAGPADEEIPRGRFEFDLDPASGSGGSR